MLTYRKYVQNVRRTFSTYFKICIKYVQYSRLFAIIRNYSQLCAIVRAARENMRKTCVTHFRIFSLPKSVRNMRVEVHVPRYVSPGVAARSRLLFEEAFSFACVPKSVGFLGVSTCGMATPSGHV